MTRHTIKTRDYPGEGKGVEITLRVVLDKITLAIISTSYVDEATKHILDMVQRDLRDAIKAALAPEVKTDG